MGEHPYRKSAAPIVRRAPLARINWWLTDYLFDRFRWWRRLRGGHWERWWIDVVHWERWWIDVVHSDVWMQNEHGKRPPCGMGSPVCEDWSTENGSEADR